MQITILILLIINTIGMIFYYVQKFNDTFCIVDREIYQTLADYWNEYHDENGEELTRELAGGTGVETGFFREALCEEEEEDE